MCISEKAVLDVYADVYADEPMPQDSPIWDLPGVIITPHMSGYSHNDAVSSHMSLVVRKPVFGVSDQVRHKPDCTATEDG